jgi:hypothetical protein
MIGTIFIVSLFALGAFVTALETTEKMLRDDSGQPINRSRAAAYGLCVLIVLAVSIGFGFMVAAGVEPGDERYEGRVVATAYIPPMSIDKRDDAIFKVFCTLILPSLLGVRVALGKKK